MKSQTTQRFRKAFGLLPEVVKDKAKKTYKLWRKDPFHPGLSFKQIVFGQLIYSVRIGISYRSIGIKKGTQCFGFELGPMKLTIH